MAYLSCKDLVKRMLSKYPATRDDDWKLVAGVWKRELEKHAPLSEDEKNLLRRIARGEVSPVESVTRARRDLQNDHKKLRGEKWEERHTTKQKSVQGELGYGG